MPIIASVAVAACRVPLDNVTSFSTRTVAARDYGLVRITSTDGVEGIGFCYVGSRAGELAPIAVEHLLGPLLVGRDSHAVEALWKRMYEEAILQGRAGTVMRCLSAIDTALWDLNARAAGLALHRFMGAAEVDSVPAYASGGYYLDGKTPADLGREMAGYVKQGFSAVKMKTGRLSPAEEEARLAAVREAVGPDVLVMMDANNAWSDLPHALDYIRRFEAYDPHFIEEPFSVDDIDSHAKLAATTPILVATGEIEAGRWRHKELLDKQGCAILQTDALVCGGVSEWKKIAAMASAYGVPMYPHWFHDLHAPLLASIPNGRFVEFFPDDQVLNFRRLIDGQMAFADGRLTLRQGPGLGFGFAEDAVETYALKSASNTAWTTVR